MDAKEIKNALKNARECIREKQYKEALKHCKSVLAQDKNNYNALVFVGVAAEGMEQYDQAEKAYQKATETAPDQILAWQGLCGFYEKNPKHNQDLVNVYQKMVKLYEDKERKNEMLRKLADLDVKIGAVSMAIAIYEDLVKSENNEEKKEIYLYKLEDILRNEKSLSEEWKNLYLSTCDAIFNHDQLQFTDTEAVVKLYVRCMLQLQYVGSKLEFKCRTLQHKFPEIVYPVEVLVIITLDKHIDDPFPVLDPSVDEFMKTISKVSQDSSYLLAGQGYIQLCNRKLIEAKDCLSRAKDQLPKAPCLQYYHALTLKHIHDFSEAEQSCQSCLKTLERKDRVFTLTSSISNTVLSLQAEMLYGVGTDSALTTALEIIQQLQENVPLQVLKGKIYMKMKDYENAEKCVNSDSPEMLALHGCILYCKNDFDKAVDRLKASVDTDPNNSWTMMWYAKALWERYKVNQLKEVIQTCYMSLLKSAKLDPYNSETFYLLGLFSQTIQHDDTRARKCYQKAFDLDTTFDDAGAALCDLLNSSEQEEETHKMLLSVTAKANPGCAKWAWLRLGLYQVKHDSANSAVTSFQSALRGDPLDNHVWECLAEAYYHRGSYTAALKAFTKASELDPNSIYCLYQIAVIKQTLGLHTEAVEEFKMILDKDSEYVPALKGIGETYLLIAKQHLSVFFNGLARDNCQQALVYLTRAASHRPDLSCIWKLLGDACSMLYPMAKETFRMEVPNKLLGKVDMESSILSLVETLELGARCYGKALKLFPECASLWHDLGFNMFHQSELKSCDHMTAEKAVNALKKALSLESSNHLHWNALGVVASSKAINNPTLAQHCFIQSIKVEATNPVAWTNLGTLYLSKDNINLAHEAFKMAQRLEPSYVAAWIGQALIAETVGDEDAMDLFRHTTELATHVEGASGYGSWVCAMLQDESKHNTDLYQYSIKQMAAIPLASTALGKYLDRIKTNATAYNMYGLLLEQQGLNKSAEESFRSAINLENCKDLSSVKANLARILCKVEKYDEAMKLYEDIPSPTAFNDLCSYGYTCYKCGKYKESYQAYQQASELASYDQEKSHALTALGMVVYKYGDPDGAKSVLLQSSQLSPPSVNGLKSLCALGITLSDGTLTMAVLQELFSKEDTDTQSDVSHLMTISHCLLENNFKGAKTYIQQCIHKNPSQSSLWRLLSQLLRRHYPASLATVAAGCAECAYRLNPILHNIQNLVTTNLLRSSSVNGPRLVKSAVKALHINPGIQDNWKNFVDTLQHQCNTGDNVKYWTSLRDSYTSWLPKVEE